MYRVLKEESYFSDTGGILMYWDPHVPQHAHGMLINDLIVTIITIFFTDNNTLYHLHV